MKYLDDALMTIGAGLIVYGIAQYNSPAAFIAAGLFCIAYALLIARSAA